jgi:2-polyprenyl-3-methyl-5-hydroxy-6-metoxy-1,4-benzoquinol methylase
MSMAANVSEPGAEVLDVEAKAAGCPACGHGPAEACERIELAEQHACYSPDVTTQRRLTSLAEIPGDAYQMRRCRACRLEYADPQRAPTAAWYEVVYQTLALYPAARWEFEYVVSSLKADDTVGEVGCGSGEFLKRCRERGVAAVGVDFSTDAVAACRRAGLTAEILDLSAGAAPATAGGRHNVIVAFQVLEHLDRAASLFALAREWAKPGATLWAAIPSDRRPSRYYQERDYLDQPPHHMTRWTEAALGAVAAGEGWEMVRVIYEPLELGARIWWASTRMPFYQILQQRGLLKSAVVEKVIRLFLAPLAFIAVKLAGAKISGQSMMAEYRRKDGR